MTKAIPDGFTAVTPYLVVKDANAQIDFDRGGSVKDSNGNKWWISTRKEALSVEEIKSGMLGTQK